MGTRFETGIQVRFRDLDMMGHVNNSVYFTYFETIRTAFHFSNVSDTLGPTVSSFILAHVSCDYLKPISLTSQVLVQMWVKKIGKTSFDYGYLIRDQLDESVEYARGESVQVCFDYSLDRVIEVGKELRKILTKYQTPEP
ncbi:MAG: acyl-CoA thioesterase [Syntrophobacteraceae bacterium]